MILNISIHKAHSSCAGHTSLVWERQDDSLKSKQDGKKKERHKECRKQKCWSEDSQIRWPTSENRDIREPFLNPRQTRNKNNESEVATQWIASLLEILVACSESSIFSETEQCQYPWLAVRGQCERVRGAEWESGWKRERRRREEGVVAEEGTGRKNSV